MRTNTTLRRPSASRPFHASMHTGPYTSKKQPRARGGAMAGSALVGAGPQRRRAHDSMTQAPLDPPGAPPRPTAAVALPRACTTCPRSPTVGELLRLLLSASSPPDGVSSLLLRVLPSSPPGLLLPLPELINQSRLPPQQQCRSRPSRSPPSRTRSLERECRGSSPSVEYTACNASFPLTDSLQFRSSQEGHRLPATPLHRGLHH